MWMDLRDVHVFVMMLVRSNEFIYVKNKCKIQKAYELSMYSETCDVRRGIDIEFRKTISLLSRKTMD